MRYEPVIFLSHFICFLSAILPCALSEPLPPYSVKPVPDYDTLFDRTEGWTGADGAYTVALDSNTTLWLFSDTWVGKVREGKHVDSTMINNSVAVQKGNDPSRASVEFYYRIQEGKPASLIIPKDGRGWFWLFDGVMSKNSLFLFLKQVVKVSNDVMGFEHVATWLGHVSNPYDIPTEWKITQQKIPWENNDPNKRRQFGSAVLAEKEWVYIYGTHETKREGWLSRSMILARASEDHLEDFSTWRFFHSGEWVEDFEQADLLCDQLGSEFSVSYQPMLQKYMILTTENGMSEKIQLRYADRPWGPWSDSITVYECPDGQWDKSYFTYAGKAHPMLSSPGEILFTYVCNSFDFFKMASDSRIYHPRFVRIRFESSEK